VTQLHESDVEGTRREGATAEMDSLGLPLTWRGGMRTGESPGCQDVVPNANDVVGSHLARDYPLNGGLRPRSVLGASSERSGDYETRACPVNSPLTRNAERVHAIGADRSLPRRGIRARCDCLSSSRIINATCTRAGVGASSRRCADTSRQWNIICKSVSRDPAWL